MPGSAQRYIGGAVGFAFAAVWATAGLGSALVCVVAAAIGYTAVRLAEGRKLSAISAGRDAVRELQSRRTEPARRPPQKSATRPRSRFDGRSPSRPAPWPIRSLPPKGGSRSGGSDALREVKEVVRVAGALHLLEASEVRAVVGVLPVCEIGIDVVHRRGA